MNNRAMRIKVVLFSGTAMLISWFSFPDAISAIANPASVYCVESGYVNELRTMPDGSQHGICMFPDKTECEEWAFFRNECGARYQKVKNNNQNESVHQQSNP
ncbi:MAG: DUF333 domain-containing protein [Nitrospirota bacterium]